MKLTLGEKKIGKERQVCRKVGEKEREREKEGDDLKKQNGME